MAAFDFPPTPAVGTLYPLVAEVGKPQYRWNGSEWVAATLDPAGYVRKSGDSMSGALSLAGDPTQALHAVPKQYLDAQRQRIQLAGIKSVDVQVPAGATVARLVATINPTGAVQFYPVIQVSVAAGVFRSTAGDYVTSGFYQTSNAPTIGNINGSTSYTGMLMANIQEGVSTTMHLNGTLALKRLNSINTHFTGDFHGSSYNTAGSSRGDFYNYLALASSGSALDILALRLATHAGNGDVWSAASYLTVEWL